MSGTCWQLNLIRLLPLSRSPSVLSIGQELLTSLSTLRSSMKTKVTNASNQLLYREETRAARVTVLVVVVVALCWGPYISSLILHTGQSPSSPPEWLNPLTLAFLICYAVISPLIYSYRSKKVQSNVKEMLGIRSRITKQEKMFKKRKSFSCPQLVLTTCQSLPVPEGEMTKKKTCNSWTDIQGRQMLLTLPIGQVNGDNQCIADQDTSERTSCMESILQPWKQQIQFAIKFQSRKASSVIRDSEQFSLAQLNMDISL